VKSTQTKPVQEGIGWLVISGDLDKYGSNGEKVLGQVKFHSVSDI
jgi:hypothetical protein